MDPMNAAQGMFGGFGMNMNNMSNGINMGYGTEQQMYSNWDNSQNNLYNPNPYSNGMGQDYGTSGYAAAYMTQPNGSYSQMQQQYPNQSFQNGYYGNGPGYMRGMGRGRGRGYYRGRGGYDHANHYQQSYQANVSEANENQNENENDAAPPLNPDLVTGPAGNGDIGDALTKDNTAAAITGSDHTKDSAVTADSTDLTDKTMDSNAHSEEDAGGNANPAAQLQGIPTIDSLDNVPTQPMGYARGPVPGAGPGFPRGRGFGRGTFTGYRGGFNNHNFQAISPTTGPGVVGAPVAPRAMREGPSASNTRGRMLSGSRRTASLSLTVGNSSRG